MKIQLQKEQRQILLGFLFVIRGGVPRSDKKVYNKVKRIIDNLQTDSDIVNLKSDVVDDLFGLVTEELSTPNEIPNAKEDEPKTRYSEKDFEMLKQLQVTLGLYHGN
jgi:hypothetical protein